MQVGNHMVATRVLVDKRDLLGIVDFGEEIPLVNGFKHSLLHSPRMRRYSIDIASSNSKDSP